MKFDLVIERFFRHPPERLWWALTDRDALASWFMETDIAAELGATFTIRGEPHGAWRGWTACRILELAPMHRVVWSFDCEERFAPTIVSFVLIAEDGGTRLRLRHEGEASAAIVGKIGGSWPLFLERLDRLPLRARSGA